MSDPVTPKKPPISAILWDDPHIDSTSGTKKPEAKLGKPSSPAKPPDHLPDLEIETVEVKAGTVASFRVSGQQVFVVAIEKGPGAISGRFDAPEMTVQYSGDIALIQVCQMRVQNDVDYVLVRVPLAALDNPLNRLRTTYILERIAQTMKDQILGPARPSPGETGGGETEPPKGGGKGAMRYPIGTVVIVRSPYTGHLTRMRIESFSVLRYSSSWGQVSAQICPNGFVGIGLTAAGVKDGWRYIGYSESRIVCVVTAPGAEIRCPHCQEEI